MEQIIRAENLKVSFPGHHHDTQEVVRGVSFALHAGELLALVGESGSGKSILCRTLLGLPPKGARVLFDALERPAPTAMSLVMQDALTALDPAMPVGKQIIEANRHCPPDPAELLTRVGIDDGMRRAKQYPGEFSGGMRQRAAIAVALAMRPRVIFADEPTTSLDASLRRKIMELLNEIRRNGTAILFVTHDLSLVRSFADRVLIMKDGQIIESGATAEIFAHPQAEYTKELIRYAALSDPANHTHGKIHYHDREIHSHEHVGAHDHADGGEGENSSNKLQKYEGDGKKNTPLFPESSEYNTSADKPHKYENDGNSRSDLLSGKLQKLNRNTEPLIEVKALNKFYPCGYRQVNHVLKEVSLAIYPGEITGLCGPSGVGKSTLARCLAGLEKPTAGTRLVRDGLNIQVIFQDSMSALNPRMTVARLIGEPLYLRDRKHPASTIILDLMEEVGLAPELLTRLPRELSGGQRQRVAIARAIAARPDLIIADEPVSSLDVTTCSRIVHLLRKLKEEHNLTMLLISHDLHLLAHVSDRIVRM